MPIYEYQCSSCHHAFDVMQKMSDAPVKTCPQCFKDSAERLVSAAGFQLKGTGWYVTDFKNKEKSKATATGSTDKKTKESTATTTKGE